MSSSQKLNSSELKSQLYHSLQQKGVLDAMKLQLRNRLVKELKQASTVPRSLPVLESLTHGIILEYLQKMGYEYTISLFALESGMGANQVPSINSTDLLKLLKIDSCHPLYKSFMDNSTGSEQGFLTTLLLSLPQLAAPQRTTVSTGTQADAPVKGSTEPSGHYTHLSLEQRILAFEKECEERNQSTMEEKINQFKNGELLRVRMDSKETLKKELQKKRTELEQQYQEKIEQVSKRERDMVQRLQRREEELEASLYSQRQLVLQELELIRQQEDHLIKQSELNKLQFSDLHSTSERVKQDEQILKKEVNRKQELLDQLQNQLTARTAEVSSVRQQYEDLWKESTTLRNELMNSKEEVHKATEQLVSLQNQKLQLEQKLKESQIEDHDRLKAENRRLKSELADNKHKLSEYSANSGKLITDQQQLICELKEELHKPTTQLATLQQQLNTAQVEHQQALMLKDLSIKRLEHQLTAQVSVNQRMLSHEQMFTPRWQQESVATKGILKGSPSKLGKTTKPKLSKPAKQVQPVYSDTEDTLSTSHTRLDHKDLSSFDRASKKFLEEMKETFLRLEREAKELEEKHPTNGYHHVPYRTTGYTNSLSSHHWQNLPLTEGPSLPSTIFSSSTAPSGTRQPLLSLPLNFSSSTSPAVSSNNLFAPSTSYELATTADVKSQLHSSNLMGSYSGGINFSSYPVTSVTFPHSSVTQLTHPPSSTIHLPTTTQTSIVNILSSLTTASGLTHPMVTYSLPTVTSRVSHFVVTGSQPVISNSVPPASVSVLASITYPLTSVTDTLTTSSPTLTSLTTVTAPLTTSSVPLVSSPSVPLTTTDDQTSSSTLTTSHSQSVTIVVTSSPHSVAVQPHLLSTTTIQEDSLTKDLANSSDASESTVDDGESPKSTKEGTLAAVLALRDQYSPRLSSSMTTVAQQPPIVLLDNLWSSRGNPATQTKQDKAQDTNETITHHSDNPTATILSKQERHTSPQTVTANNITTASLYQPDKPITATTTASSVQPRSPSPPTVTADVTTPSQSLDDTMGKYLQLLQQKQQDEEEKSTPTTTHNTYKEEESAMTYNTSDNGGKISDDGFEDW